MRAVSRTVENLRTSMVVIQELHILSGNSKHAKNK
jgi:hypothetical protein